MCGEITDKKEIKKILKEKYEIALSDWPRDIHLSAEKNELTLILNDKAVGFKPKNENKKENESYRWINMQEDSACFEGWAVVLKAQNEKISIKLKVDGIENFNFNSASTRKSDLNNTKKHYARFLYRAARFLEQYGDWFFLDKSLADIVEKFKEEYLEKEGLSLTNNVPTRDAGVNQKRECQVETALADNKNKEYCLSILKGADCLVDEENQVLYRQLPVGLFVDEVSTGNALFTGGASDIDLWTINKEEKIFQIIELKANGKSDNGTESQNRRIGIITEIFFYSNFMRDFLVRNKRFKLNSSKTKFRGYNEIVSLKKKQGIGINGIMLSNGYHPLIREHEKKILQTLNANSAGIKYFCAKYNLEELGL